MKRTRIGRLASFLMEVKNNWLETGAVLPSSRRLAKSMCSPIPEFLAGRAPRRILEVGSGTGVITEEIIKSTAPEDKIVLYELNEEFAAVLKRRIKQEWKKRRIELRVKPFPEGIRRERYDLAVCSLPFNNFPCSIVKSCLDAFGATLGGGGYLTFFEYCFIRKVRMRVSIGDAMRLKRIECHVEKYLKRHKIDRDTVVLNVPPAWVHTLYFP